jgi:hypothetical protein
MPFRVGANPWRIDGDNRAVLHVKNVDVPADGQKKVFMVTLYYEGAQYNLPLQLVEAGQTMEIDIKKLRDDQVKDSSGNVIPLTVTSGQLSWYPRAKKGDFIGRLVQYNPAAAVSSSFSCDEPCWCDYDYLYSFNSPSSYSGVPGNLFQVTAYEVDQDCRGWPHGPFQIPYASFYTINPSVADVVYQNNVLLVGAGCGTIVGQWDSVILVGETCTEWDWASGWCMHAECDYESVPANGYTSVASRPSISISQNTPLWFFGNSIDPPASFTLGSTRATLTANGATTGTFQWTIIYGTEKLTLGENPGITTVTNTDSNTINIRSMGGSINEGDVVIRLRYTLPRNAPTLVQRLDDSDPLVQYLAVITLAETFGKYQDYAPGIGPFNKNPQYYRNLWKKWWAENSH